MTTRETQVGSQALVLPPGARAVSVHVYLGAMALGADRVLPVVQSHESWKDGIWARETAQNPTPWAPLDAAVPESSLALANPPCSRFSCGSSPSYRKKAGDQFGDLREFPELLQSVDVAERARASVFWWETGPQLRTKGLGMVAAVHRRLECRWSLVLQCDPRWYGVPQARPRCHVVHCRGSAPPPEAGDLQRWPALGVGPWIDAELSGRWGWDQPGTPVIDDNFHRDSRSAVETARAIASFSTFGQNDPRIVSRDDLAAPTVLSGRTMAWLAPPRWWTAAEFSALTTAPPEWGERIARAGRTPSRVIGFLSKGVVADVAESVCRGFVAPALAGVMGGGEGPLAEEIMENIYGIRQLAPHGASTGHSQGRRQREGG